MLHEIYLLLYADDMVLFSTKPEKPSADVEGHGQRYKTFYYAH